MPSQELLTQARAALDGLPVPAEPDVAERFAIVLDHARKAIAFEREETRAMLDFRKHLGWYTKGLPDGAKLRQELFAVRTLQDVAAILESYMDRYAAVAA